MFLYFVLFVFFFLFFKQVRVKPTVKDWAELKEARWRKIIIVVFFFFVFFYFLFSIFFFLILQSISEQHEIIQRLAGERREAQLELA